MLPVNRTVILCSKACGTRQLARENNCTGKPELPSRAAMCIKPWLPDEVLGYHKPFSISNTTAFHAKLPWAFLSRFNCWFSLHSAHSIIWHWLGQLSQGNAPGNGCCLSHPSWLRIFPTASHPCRTVPVVHRALQRSNWELQSTAAAGSSTAEPSLLQYHFCEFPLRSLCHWKEYRSVSIWITVRLVGAERMVEQKQTEWGE